VTRAFARRLARRDVLAAGLILRQADRLERDGGQARADEAEALEHKSSARVAIVGGESPPRNTQEVG